MTALERRVGDLVRGQGKWLWHKDRELVTLRELGAEQDSLSQQVEVGAAEHLAFEGFDAADVAFDRAAAVGHGEPVGDGGLVAADAAGEGVQVGRGVEVDCGDPTASKIKNIKELRPGSSGTSEIRILFVSGPWRSAILLVAGDKSGKWNRWYAEMIPHAEQLYEIYLKQRAEEETGR